MPDNDRVSALRRNNVTVQGSPEAQPMLFAHGFGCDQNMWRYVWPAFKDEYRIILIDYVGTGATDASAYDAARYSTLAGYAADVLEVCDELMLSDVIFVGHSVSSMVGVIAANERPGLFTKLVLVGPSPRYINDSDYVGGFEPEDIEGLLAQLDSNYLGWSTQMAPVIMGNADRPELGEELTNSFCRADPEIARQFARVTFMSDNRADLETVEAPALVLQCADDAIAPREVGEYVAQTLPRGTLRLLTASGHCPNLSAPDETIEAIRDFL
jgi:sigma-B regulation protein RsbQ